MICEVLFNLCHSATTMLENELNCASRTRRFVQQDHNHLFAKYMVYNTLKCRAGTVSNTQP